MIVAIVYNTYAGHTKKYAEMLSESILLPMFSVEDAKKYLPKDSEIIYLSWVKNNRLTKYNFVKKYFNVAIVGVVGLNNYDKEQTKINFIGYNNINTDKVFFLKGGIDLEKLQFLSKSYIQNFGKKLKDCIIKNGIVSTKQYEQVALCENGGSYISKSNLNGLIGVYNKNYYI